MNRNRVVDMMKGLAIILVVGCTFKYNLYKNKNL